MHRPKDKDIRDLCGMAGVTWPEPTPRTTSQQPSDDEESSFWDEGEGSEEETDDEEVEIENEGWINY